MMVEGAGEWHFWDSVAIPKSGVGSRLKLWSGNHLECPPRREEAPNVPERERRGARGGQQKAVDVFLITFAYAAVQTD